jgi:hypothetical protein
MASVTRGPKGESDVLRLARELREHFSQPNLHDLGHVQYSRVFDAAASHSDAIMMAYHPRLDHEGHLLHLFATKSVVQRTTSNHIKLVVIEDRTQE